MLLIRAYLKRLDGIKKTQTINVWVALVIFGAAVLLDSCVQLCDKAPTLQLAAFK